MNRIPVIIEKAGDGFLGRITYRGDLIVEEAETLEKLEAGLRKLLTDFYGIGSKSLILGYRYDLSALFEKFDYLKISTVAGIAGLNASLLRQYVTGKKHASATQAKKIEAAIHKIGQELSAIKVYSK